MNNNITTVSIAVLNYNTSDLLNKTLASIVSSRLNDVSFDVLVIDNASSDGGFEHVDESFKADSRFTFMQLEKNVGLLALNMLLEKTQGKYVLTLDPDAFLYPEALQALVDFLEQNPEAGAATGNLLNLDGSLQRYYRRLMAPKIGFFTTVIGRILDKYLFNLRYHKYYRYDDADLSRVVEIEQPPVTCLMIRRSAIRECIIRPSTPFYFTDVGLCKSIYNQGYKIFLIPEARVTHLKSTSFKKTASAWQTREFYRSLMGYFQEEYPMYAPFMWMVFWIDRIMRATMLRVVGREPVR